MEMNRYLKLLLFFCVGLAIFSLARLGLYIMYYDQFSSYKLGEIISTFIGGIRFDASILMTITAPFWLLLMLPIQNMIYHKIILWALYPVYIFCVVMLTVDVIYYGYVSRHITSEPFLMGNDMSFMIDMLPSYIIPFIVALIIFIVCGFLWKKLVDIKIKPDLKCIFANVSIILIISGLCYIVIRGNIDTKPIALIDAYDKSDTNLGNLKLNGLFSTTRYLDDDNVPIDTYQFFDNDTALKIIEKTHSTKCDKSALTGLDFKNSNVVLIMLESVSAQYVDSFSKADMGITPNIDNLSKTAIKFTNHYSVNKRSISSIQAALTGVPQIKGLPNLGVGLESYVTGNLGKIFADNGYDTIFVQSSKRRSFYMDSIASSLGFRSYYGMEDVKPVLDYPDKNASFFGWDYETFMLLADKIKDQFDKSKRPFFAFIFTGTTHEPYPALPKQFTKFEHIPSSENAFKNTLIYADWSLGEFMNSLKNKPFYDDTIFIITSDHSNSHIGGIKYPQDFWIPFMIYSPKLKKGVEIKNITSHIDLSQTITDLVGLADDVNNESIFCKDINSTAMLYHGNTVGLVTSDGYLNHSLKDVLDYSLADDNSTKRINELSDYIKAYHQVVFNKVMSKKNAGD